MIHFLLRKRCLSRIRREWLTRKGCFVDYRQVKQLLLLVEEQAFESLKPWMKTLIEQGITLHVMVLEIKGLQVSETVSGMTVYYVTPEDLSWHKSFLKRTVLDRLTSIPIDAVMDLSQRVIYPFYQLMLHLGPTMRLGLEKGEITPYDYQLQTTQTIAPIDLGEKLCEYWRSIVVLEKNNS